MVQFNWECYYRNRFHMQINFSRKYFVNLEIIDTMDRYYEVKSQKYHNVYRKDRFEEYKNDNQKQESKFNVRKQKVCQADRRDEADTGVEKHQDEHDEQGELNK